MTVPFGKCGIAVTLGHELVFSAVPHFRREYLERLAGPMSPHARRGIMLEDRPFVAADVSKDHLDIAFPGASRIWRTANDAGGMAAFGRKLEMLETPHLVCEATGSLTRSCATGRLAKTDAIDAVILRFAQTMQRPAAAVPSEAQIRSTDLVRRRCQLVDVAAMEKQRPTASKTLCSPPFAATSVF